MPILEAENSFRKGLMNLVDGNHEKAATFFRAAMDIEKTRQVQRPQLRYLSYYGLSLARSHRVNREALRACETASRLDPWDPDLRLNLGRVYALAGKMSQALKALEKGLALSPNHRVLRNELASQDRRTSPPLPFLKRSHTLNLWLGKLRYSMFRGASTSSQRDGKESAMRRTDSQSLLRTGGP